MDRGASHGRGFRPQGSSRTLVAGTVLVALAACAAPVGAQDPDPNLWGVDNSIGRVARSGNTIYVSGAFTQAGPNTGCGVPIDRRTGVPIAGFPKVAGVLNAVIADGEGGWYIGGALVGVGGLPRSGVAHILPDGRVSAWAPACDGRVLALALQDGTLYVGGEFTRMDGEARSNLAAFDRRTGRLEDWNPGADSRVHALLPNGATIYVGGNFAQIAGVARNSLAEVSLETALATAWNPQPGFSGTGGSVRALAMIGDTVYVGGSFGSVGGQLRYNAGAVHAITGLATAWSPHASGFPDNRYDGSPYVTALVPGESTMYVAGHFAFIKGQPRGGLAEVDLVTGELTDWNPTPRLNPGFENYSPYAGALLVTKRTLYVCGNWSFMGEVARRCIAEVDRVTGEATPWNPRPNTIVDVLALSGDVVYAGGRFDSMGEWETRFNLAAFDATTGRLKSWNPSPDGLVVNDLVVHGDRIYVGGHFWTIGGGARRGMAALDAVTGEALDWAADMDEVPIVFTVAGDRLYVGGKFTTIGGVPRRHIAAFDLNTGQLTDWSPEFDDDVFDIAVSGDRVYVGGFFGTANGTQQPYLAALDPTTGELLDWNPKPDSWIHALAVRGNTVYAGGAFRNFDGVPRSRLAALDATTGGVLPWVADAAQSNPNLVRVFQLELAGDNLYVGGSFHSIAGEPRSGLAALDAETGAVLPWNPAPGDPTTDYPLKPAVIWALTSYENTLYVGGRFRYVGTTPATTLAAVPIDAVPVVVPEPGAGRMAMAPVWPNPVRANATVRFALPASTRVTLTVYDVQGRQVASLLRGTVLPGGVHEVPLAAGGWREGFYFIRLQVDGQAVTQKFVVLE